MCLTNFADKLQKIALLCVKDECTKHPMQINQIIVDFIGGTLSYVTYVMS